MITRTLIQEKLHGQYRNFLEYCAKANRNFIEELSSEDFNAYRSEYSVPPEEVEQLKNFLGFQETPEKKSFQEFPLRKIFKIELSPSYENVLVTDVDFSGRVQNLLKKNNVKMLSTLLDLSLQEVSVMPGFGKNSVDNLVETLKKFSVSKKKKISVKVFNRAKEELDKFLRDAALRHDPQIDLIIAAFENFSSALKKKASTKNPLVKKINALPTRLKNKKVRLLLNTYDFKHKKIFDELPDDLTLSVFPDWLAENSLTPDEDELLNFVEGLRIDLKAFAKKIADAPFKNQRECEIIRRRAQRITLEEIGNDFGVTRERIRQIEVKAVQDFAKSNFDVRKLFYFLHALMNGKSFITLDDAKNFIDADDAEIIWFLSAKMNLYTEVFYFDKEIKSFVFHYESDFDDSELLKNLPDVMDEESFNLVLENLSREKNCPVDFLQAKLFKYYNRSGRVFHRDRLTLAFKCAYILKKKFPSGFKIADKTFYARFTHYLKEIFDEKSYLAPRNVDAKISMTGVLCNRGKYIHPDFVNIPSEIIDHIKNFIDNSDRTTIFYKDIFESLRKVFMGTQITNRYFLQGVIRFYKLPYTLCKDYLTKIDETEMSKDFDLFVKEKGEVSAQEIEEHFVSFNYVGMMFLRRRCPEIVRVGEGKFLHSSRLNLQKEDFSAIKSFLNKNCASSVNVRSLFEKFSNRFSDFVKRNKISDSDKLFGVLQYMFRDEFSFSRPYISIADMKNLENKKVLLRILADTNEIEIKELLEICDERKISHKQKNVLLESLLPDFVRIDEFTLQRPESIGITDEIISAVVEKIRAAIKKNGGWKAAKNFDDYESLPQLEISWNSFLLESVASLAEEAVYKLRSFSTLSTYSAAVFVSEDFAEDDFKTFLLKILIAENEKTPFRSKGEIFTWLNEQGLCAKTLPKFLVENKAFEGLDD